MKPFDLVIGCEVVYLQESLAPLLATLKDMSHASSLFLLAYRGYRPEWNTTVFARFLSMLSQEFDWFAVRPVRGEGFPFRVTGESSALALSADGFSAILEQARSAEAHYRGSVSIFVLRRKHPV